MSDQVLNSYKPLREFLDDVHHNTKAAEQHQSEFFNKLDQINKTFAGLVDLLDFSEEWFLVFFVLRSHASLLAATTLSTSAQLPDSYGTMRSVLENTLYAFFFWRHKNLIEPWLRRQENEQAKQRVRDKLKSGKMISELKSVNRQYGEIFDTLYNDTIDYGAHPNVASVLTNIEQFLENDKVVHKLKYFNPDPPFIDLALKHLCRTGVLSLKIFGIIWYHRLKLTDFFQTIDILEKGL